MSVSDLEKLKTTLNDAGFDEDEIKEFMELYNNSTVDNQYECLKKKRKKLLEKIHKNEKCITCLDYLKYSLEKGDKEDKDE